MKVLLVSFGSLIQALYHGWPREIARLPGVKLTVIVPPYWKEQWSKVRRRLEVKNGDGYRIIQAPMFFTGHLHFAVFRASIGKLMRDYQPDVLDIENEPFNAASAQLIFLRNRFAPRTRIVMHTSQNVFKSYPPPFSLFERYAHRNVSAFFARNSDAVEVLRKKHYHGIVDVVTHGVDTTSFQTTARNAMRSLLGFDREIVVGFVGTLGEHKGVDLLLQAVQPLNCWLLIIGDGDQRHRLEELARQLGIADRVLFRSSLEHHDVARHLSAMDMLVLPSRGIGKAKEQFGRVLIEAMAAGVPVIGSDCGEIPNVIGDAGLVFPENNWHTLRESIQLLTDDPTKREVLAKKGRERVRKLYDWKVIVKTIHSIYQRVLD